MKLFCILLGVLFIAKCGSPASSSSVQAVPIASPPGLDCFAITNTVGEVVGGNCHRR